MRSLRSRLIAWLLTGFVVVLVPIGIAGYRVAREEIGVLLDRQLRDTALSLRRQSLLAVAIGAESIPGEEGDVVVQIWDRLSGLAYVSRSDRELPLSRDQGFATVQWQGEQWRTYTLDLGVRAIQVGQPMRERVRVAARSALLNLLPFLALFPLSAAIVWFGVRQALRPADEVAAEVARRRHDDLQPLPVATLPQELRPFAESINRLLGRLASAFAAQRRFVGDASHELRTPLAALRLQLGNLERARDEGERREAIEALHAGLQRATRLIEQLLALARLDPDTALARTPVDVERVVRDVLADLSPLAEAKDIDLGLVESAPVRVSAHPESIRLIVGNLVDNAIRYTPPGGRVDIRVQRTSGASDRSPGSVEAVSLEVCDTGPGIAAAERERVFDRFYRGGGAAAGASGSGLGLAIVRQAVEQANGTIALDEGAAGTGLRVTVRLPADAGPTQGARPPEAGAAQVAGPPQASAAQGAVSSRK